jgi:hypothetical protein
MKAISILFVLFLLIILGCSKDSNPIKSDENSYSYELTFQFNTLDKPQSLCIDDEKQLIYILSGQIHSTNDNLVIQKFNFDGNLLATTVDFYNYSKGLYPRYSPIDITLDNEHNLCVLTIPYKKDENTEYWESYDGFCIMIHDHNGEFLNELDFSNIILDFNPEVLIFKDNLFYVTNSFSLFKISKSTWQLTEISLPKVLDNTFPANLISDLAINSNNNIWFVGQTTGDSLATNYIAKMDSEGNQLFRFNSVNQIPILHAAMSQPAIQLDEKNIIYLTTFSCKSLEIYDSSGNLLKDYNLGKNINENVLPIDLEISNKKKIYILDNWNDKVYVLSKIKA